MDLRALLSALGLAAFPTGALAQDAYACTVTTTCAGLGPCTIIDHPLRLLIAQEGALVTSGAGHQMGFDRPVTLTERGPVRAFAAVTLLDTTMLLTFDRDAGTLMFTEHGRDAAGPRAVTSTATCRPEGG